MVRESKIIHGIEVGRLSEAWKKLDKVHSRLRKKLMGILNCAASGFAEMGLSREIRRGKCIG